MQTQTVDATLVPPAFSFDHRVRNAALNPEPADDHIHAVESIAALSMVVEARDPYTAGHQWRVSRFARLIADYAKLPRAVAATCELAGFVHDVGKVGIPDAVLQKTAKLDANEFAIIKTHPLLGFRLIWQETLNHAVMDAILHHHEHPDGTGYPDQLTESQISLTAGIVGLSDALDAMTSDRPYRKGMPLARALDIIREARGRQFVTRWVDVLLNEVPTDRLTHIIGHSYPGIPLMPCPVCQGPVARFEDTDAPINACRICGAGLTQNGQALTPSGQMATAEDLAPRADKTVVTEIIGRCLLEQALQP